ncbi:MAG TPA: LysR family transcriptional regulator, partial [Franconibacter helveticus]|nr:LysR family transcriptional regulator [Franconibacter helveticus]
PVAMHGAGERLVILKRVDSPLSSSAQTLLVSIRKSMPV